MPTNARSSTQIFEEGGSVEGDANDECSSYGTHNSYEGDMEKVVDAPIDGVVETLRALKASNATMVASIASIVASQGTVVEKLNSLEKAVVTVQFEMTWVRDDMKGVHTIMEKHTENDTELRDSNAEVVRQLRHECDEGISTEPWKGKGQVEEGCEATPRSRPLAKRACTQEEPIGENDGTFADGGYIEETQNHSQYVERLTSIASSPEDENVSDWEAEYAAALGQSSLCNTQAQMRLQAHATEEESQQLALSCPSAQPRTRAAGDKVWADFRNAVQKWPPPTPEGHGRQHGWMSTKRGRGSSPDSEHNMTDTANGTFNGENSAMNLNEPPEKHVLNHTGIVRGHVPGNVDTRNNKRRGRGGGRGNGRGRRPPPMQPRYHSTVRRACKVPLSHMHCYSLVPCVAAPRFAHIVHVLRPVVGMQQGLMEEGEQCYILYPSNGIRPVAEGIAGRASAQLDLESPIDNIYMKTLCEDGLQDVTVTRVYKKNVPLMYAERTSPWRFLDDVTSPPAPFGTTVKWCVRYLVPREEQML